MKNKDFDNIDKLAQDAFEQFEVEFDPMDWMDMQSKLRAESSIDQMAKDALKDYEAAFDKRDWRRLEKQLDKKKNLYPHVWWLKGAEIGVMTLLLFTIFNLTTNKNHHNHSNQNYDKTTTLTPSSSSDFSTTKHNDSEVFPIKERATQDPSSKVAKGSSPQAMLERNEASSHPGQMEGAQKRLAQNSLIHPTKVNNYENSSSLVENQELSNNEVPNQTTSGFTGKDGTIVSSNSTTNGDQNDPSTLFSNDLARIENTATSANISDNDKTMRSMFSILEIPTIELTEGIKTTDPIFELKKAKLELPYNCKSYLGGVVVVGANFATSLGGTSVGYGAGLTMDSELSPRIAIKTGLIASYKKYELNELITLDKTSVDGKIYEIDQSKTTNLLVLEIPLEVQYTFFKNEKWKIYATAGLVANIISSRTYNGFQKTNANGLSISTEINSSNYERGAFEGGDFTKNTFLSVGGGLGLERQLGDKISLYILPSYRHALTTTGSDKDLIHSFGVNIGIKTAL
ncbi:porin family protein [Aureispira anguillae]|uniref:Porin family protein n=1 Tax=Aureispira anguillae TaxID=2864201 RepID=A0A915YI95_9BACT|nr:porin family protein [Aureispira anguillae]BDS13383.1 porin family protein [Aureispira anguillae]